jgi:hypothetical protein
MKLAQRYGPGWWFVGAASRGLVKTEGLEGSGKGKEQQGRSGKDTKIEMEQAIGPQEGMSGGTGHDFLVLAEICTRTITVLVKIR